MISKGEVITDAERMDDLIEVMTGSRFGFEPQMFQCPVSGNCWEVNPSDVCEIQDGPMNGLDYEEDVDEPPLWNPTEMCEVCECFLVGGEEIVCEDCANYQADDEPDVDEAQEWYDFDPDC